jgi:hypothetical protein
MLPTQYSMDLNMCASWWLLDMSPMQHFGAGLTGRAQAMHQTEIPCTGVVKLHMAYKPTLDFQDAQIFELKNQVSYFYFEAFEPPEC